LQKGGLDRVTVRGLAGGAHGSSSSAAPPPAVDRLGVIRRNEGGWGSPFFPGRQQGGCGRTTRPIELTGGAYPTRRTDRQRSPLVAKRPRVCSARGLPPTPLVRLARSSLESVVSLQELLHVRKYARFLTLDESDKCGSRRWLWACTYYRQAQVLV